MFWGGFSASGVRSFARIDGMLNAERYQEMLRDHLLPNLPRRRQQRRLLIFQQDNAPAHAAQSTIAFLRSEFNSVMEWPALSPDLNPIENVWCIMVRRLYAGNKQYSAVREFEEAVVACWNALSNAELRRLADSVSDRAVAVLRANGGAINC